MLCWGLVEKICCLPNLCTLTEIMQQLMMLLLGVTQFGTHQNACWCTNSSDGTQSTLNPEPLFNFTFLLEAKKSFVLADTPLLLLLLQLLLLILSCWIQHVFKSSSCCWIQHVLSLLVIGTYIFEFNMSWVTQKIPVGNYNVKMSIVDEEKKVWFFLWCN
jgi:hypothetical protein